MDPLSMRIPADPAALSTLRSSVRTWLESLEIVEADVVAIVAACSEVVADAVEHAAADTEAIEVAGEISGADVVVRVAGPVGWEIEARPSRYVAALLVDDVTIERSPERTSVVLRKTAGRGLRGLGEY